jgi:hypothetical protein
LNFDVAVDVVAVTGLAELLPQDAVLCQFAAAVEALGWQQFGIDIKGA